MMTWLNLIEVYELADQQDEGTFEELLWDLWRRQVFRLMLCHLAKQLTKLSIEGRVWSKSFSRNSTLVRVYLNGGGCTGKSHIAFDNYKMTLSFHEVSDHLKEPILQIWDTLCRQSLTDEEKELCCPEPMYSSDGKHKYMAYSVGEKPC